jgi:hypothetical protein
MEKEPLNLSMAHVSVNRLIVNRRPGLDAALGLHKAHAITIRGMAPDDPPLTHLDTALESLPIVQDGHYQELPAYRGSVKKVAQIGGSRLVARN